MRTITEKYYAVQEGKFSKSQFLKDAQRELPNLISKFNGFEDTVQILKNKGILAEAKKETIHIDAVSSESLQRGIDRELEAMGLDSVETPSEEAFNKAKAKALKNLTKDVNFYLNKVAGESSKVDKHDKEVEVKRGAAEKDVFNGMKKATLKERKEQLLEMLASIIGRAKEYAEEKWPELSDKDINDFIKMHGKEIMDGDDLETSFDNFVYQNFDLDENKLKEAIKNIIRNTLTEETVTEIDKDSYERIDGLTNLSLLDQLLGNAEAIYKDQIESGDMFDAQDVAEYLANKIYDKISKIDPEAGLEEGKKVEGSEGGKTLKEEDYDTGGYVESMHPDLLDSAIEQLQAVWEDWKDGPMTEPQMIPFAKKDLLSYISNILD